MKTTLELPDDLLSEIKFRASYDGRNLEDAVADLLRKGLTVEPYPYPVALSAVKTDPATGLPFFQCDPDAPVTKMSAEQMGVFIQQIQEEEDLERVGISVRR